VSTDAGVDASGFTLLAVCTGNVCRSPLAEALLAAGLGPAGPVRVGSAGIRARAGAGVDPRMAARSTVPIPGSAARQLVRHHVAGADLVLTMTRDQRRAVVTLLPAAVRRTFTLREFADLAGLAADSGVLTPGADPARSLGEVVAGAARLRARRPARPDDDIDDPFGAADDVYDRVALEIRAAVSAIVRAVAPDGRRPEPSARSA
jgi:protein-tyrosine phosphatase